MTAKIRSLTKVRSTGATDAAEWKARVELAAAFRIANRLGWNEGIANHFSMIVPGTTDRFLLNPYELHFREIKASNLIVVDAQGNKLAGEGQVRKVAFMLHGQIHLARKDAVCVLHAHPPYATAIAGVKGGRIGRSNAIAMGFERSIAYDDEMNGPVSAQSECDRLLNVIGKTKTVVIHAMHGMTSLGKTVAHAFDCFYYVERLCMYTVLARQYGGELHSLPESVMRDTSDRDIGLTPSAQEAHFQAQMRVLDLDEADYRN
jgi:ribulose-5-phosphate 4-epimerase/fuculose-1-phosphate aldolase